MDAIRGQGVPAGLMHLVGLIIFGRVCNILQYATSFNPRLFIDFPVITKINTYFKDLFLLVQNLTFKQHNLNETYRL